MSIVHFWGISDDHPNHQIIHNIRIMDAMIDSYP